MHFCVYITYRLPAIHNQSVMQQIPKTDREHSLSKRRKNNMVWRTSHINIWSAIQHPKLSFLRKKVPDRVFNSAWGRSCSCGLAGGWGLRKLSAPAENRDKHIFDNYLYMTLIYIKMKRKWINVILLLSIWPSNTLTYTLLITSGRISFDRDEKQMYYDQDIFVILTKKLDSLSILSKKPTHNRLHARLEEKIINTKHVKTGLVACKEATCDFYFLNYNFYIIFLSSAGLQW